MDPSSKRNLTLQQKKLHYNNNLAHRYGIEKSQTLLNNLHEKVIILGTEFHEQSLIDKEMDVIFCNPPYSEYEEWARKKSYLKEMQSIFIL